MRIVGIYSFNGGREIIEAHFEVDPIVKTTK